MAKRIGKRSVVTRRLSELLDDSERSQTQIARDLNKSRTTLSEWKAGRSEPQHAVADRAGGGRQGCLGTGRLRGMSIRPLSTAEV